MAHSIAFGGTTLRQKQVSGLTVAEAWYPPGARVPEHTHEHAHVGFLLEGVCRESVGNRHYDYERMSVVVKRPGESHSNEAGPHGTRYLIVDAEEEASAPGVFDERVQLRAGRLSVLGVRLREELHAVDPPSALAMEGLLLELFAEIERSKHSVPTAPPPWIEVARELILDRWNESFTMRSIAAEVGVHPAHLARSFRRHVGVTPGAYLRQVRVERALGMIEAGVPLSEVAGVCGFCDQSHMTNAVRRATGMTPDRYRKGLRSR